jgi:RNA polymerase sigma factor (sigma-70 family)
MTDPNWLATRFEQHRAHLRSVAYDMLGSVSEAEDAVQECWLRLDRSDSDSINELRSWLTAVLGRICIDMLRARRARRTDYVGSWLPEPLIEEPPEQRPDRQAELTDTLGLALLIVLESLTPPERLAFVLHDVFAVPFDEIAAIMDRSPAAARQLATRARRRIQSAPQPDTDVALQQRLVDAFLAAARSADFDALLTVLAPDAVMRLDAGPRGLPTLSGAAAVANHVLSTAPRFISFAAPVLVNGAAGLLFGTREKPIAVLGFTIVGGQIAAMDLVATAAKLRHLRIDPSPRPQEPRRRT